MGVGWWGVGVGVGGGGGGIVGQGLGFVQVFFD